MPCFRFLCLGQRRIGSKLIDRGAGNLRLKVAPLRVSLEAFPRLLAYREAFKGNQEREPRHVFSGRGRSQNGANAGATEGRVDSSRRAIAPRGRMIRPEFKNAVSAARWPGVKLERIGTRDQDLRFTAFPIRACSLDVRMSRNFATDLDHLCKTRECCQDERLRSVRRNERVQEHLWTTMDLSKIREKRATEIGVQMQHLIRVIRSEALERNNPGLFSGTGTGNGVKASKAGGGRNTQR